MPQAFCLKWNNHMHNMRDVFKNLLLTDSMVDVTLACEGLNLKAHKIVLSACSDFFRSLFLENPCKHPIVILKDMKYEEIKAIIDFMYDGEINVAQEQLAALIKTSRTLKVKGLAESTNDDEQSGNELSYRPSSRTDTPPPPKRRKRRTRKRSVSDRSNDGASGPKIKQSDSDIEELSSDTCHNTSIPNEIVSAVPSQTHTNFSRKYQQDQHVVDLNEPAEQHFGNSFIEEKINVKSLKLQSQTIATDDLSKQTGKSSVVSNIELQKQPQNGTDHFIMPITSTPMTSDSVVSNQHSEILTDIKPELLHPKPPMFSAAGRSSVLSYMKFQKQPRNITDNFIMPITSTSMTLDTVVSNQHPESPTDIKPELLHPKPSMYSASAAGLSHSADEISTISGLSGYQVQDNSEALVPSDSQPQKAKRSGHDPASMKLKRRNISCPLCPYSNNLAKVKYHIMMKHPEYKKHSKSDSQKQIKYATETIEPVAEMHTESIPQMHTESDPQMHTESDPLMHNEPVTVMHNEPVTLMHIEPVTQNHIEPLTQNHIETAISEFPTQEHSKSNNFQLNALDNQEHIELDSQVCNEMIIQELVELDNQEEEESEARFPCPFCSYSNRKSESLKLHIKEQHNEYSKLFFD